MGLVVFAVVTVAATFALLVVGGTVNPTGSSLACPDWPTCYGSFFPEMTDGVEYEHTHRVVAAAVGLLTIVLAGWVWTSRKDDPAVRALSLLAAVLVVVQGLLGGITVMLRLPLLVSTAHLALSMIFFSLLIYIALRLWPRSTDVFRSVHAKATTGDRIAARTWTAAASLLVYLQIVLGAFVRHTKSGHACNQDWVLCAGQVWPAWHPAQLHMAHRFAGLLVMSVVVAVGVVAWRAAERHAHPGIRWLALAAPVLVVTQVALGMLTVATGIALVPVAAHLGVGALLLGNLVVLFFALPARAAAPTPSQARSADTLGNARGATA